MQSAQSRVSVREPSNAASKFRLIAELGRGGMATVYLAIRSGVGGFNKLQVVKQLHPSLANDPAFLKMFLEEARLAARLNHPNVVQTYEIGVDAAKHFIAMEYLEGPPLEAIAPLLRKKDAEPNAAFESFTIPMRLRILADVLAGLQYAHELTDFDGKPLHIVHRDVSPHNVIVTYDGHVKLVDFGIAKAADSSDDTSTGVMKGKCAYMAPERFGRSAVDHRSDVFSVGAMMWHLLTGEKLWKGLSDLEIFQKIATGELPSPRTVDPNIPADLEAICMKGLALKVQDRYQSAAEMQTALEDYLQKFPRLTARDLGTWVSTQFAERRAKIKAIVETQMKQETGPIPQLVIPGARESSDGLPVDEDVAGQAADEMPAPAPAAARPGMARAVRLISLAAVVVIGGVALLVTGAKQKATEGNTKPAKPVTPLGVSATPLVTLTLKAVPASASIYLDDVKLPSNPSTSTMVRDGAQHRVRVEAPGFATKRDFVVFDSDVVNTEFELEPEKAATATKTPDPKAAPVWRPSAGGAKTTTAKPAETTAQAAPTAEPTAAPTAAPTTEPTTKKNNGKKLVIDTSDDPWKK